MKTVGLLVLSIALFLPLAQTPAVRAGSFSIAPSTIYGTVISFSASYPDFRFGESSTNISLSVSVTFNNASISAVNVTAVYVTLYYPNVNLDQITNEGYPPSTQNAYADGNWLSTDEWYGSAHAPQKMQRPSPEVASATWSPGPVTLYYYGERTQQVQAKLYIMVRVCFLDTNGQPIFHSTGGTFPFNSSYHWAIYTGEGEAPDVTIFPRVEQQSGLPMPETLALVVGSIVVIVVITAVIVTRRKRTKKKAPIEGTRLPSPPQQTLGQG